MLSPADAKLVRRDGGLPELETVLDPELFALAFAKAYPAMTIDSCQLIHVRYRPGQSCIALYQITGAFGEQWVYAKINRASRRGVTFHVFPDDRKLRVLRRLHDEERRAELWKRLFPARDDGRDLAMLAVSYRPERRFVARIGSDTEPFALKAYSSREVRGAFMKVNWFSSCDSLIVPQEAARSRRHRVNIVEWIEGPILRDVMDRPDLDSRVLAQVGAALRSLHRQRLDDATAMRDGETARLERVSDFVAAIDPDLAPATSILTTRLCAALSAAGAPGSARVTAVHGDFHAKQVILAESGTALLDFDSSGIGDPAVDLGWFAADLEADALFCDRQINSVVEMVGSLIDGYGEAPYHGFQRRIRIYTSVGLLLRVARPFRYRAGDWPDRCAEIVHRATEIFDQAEPPSSPTEHRQITFPTVTASRSAPLAIRDPHVFVVGCPRSGTTLLQRMLDNHPDLSVINDSHFITRCIRRLRTDARIELADDGDIALTHDVVTSLCQYRRFHRLGLTEVRVRQLADESRTLGDFVRCIYSAIATDRGKTFAGEKTPDYVLHIKTLNRMFPTARFVHIIRDGRDVGLSLRDWATPSKGPGRLDLWEADPVATSALWWRRFVVAGRDAGATLSSNLYAEVRYETLVATPELELERLSDFLGLPYRKEMVEFHVGRTRIDPALDAKKAWRPAETGLRDWQSALDLDDQGVVEALTGELLTELGMPTSLGPPNAEAIKRAKRSEDWWHDHYSG